MKLTVAQKIVGLFILALFAGMLLPQSAIAAEKKDKAARRQALMMQKMKQDMEAEKAAMQTQFDTEKKALQEQLLAKDTELEKTNKALASSQRKAKNLSIELTKTMDEKTVVETKLTETQAKLDTTQNSLTVLGSV